MNRGGVLAQNSPAYQAEVDPAYYSLNIAGSIATDPLGSVSLTGDQIAIVSGSVTAPGGVINLNGGTATFGPTPILFAGAGVWVTQTGSLSAAGTAVSLAQNNGLVFDDVLPAGSVNLSGGYIVLAPGSIVDVSGASGISSLQAAGSGAAGAVSRSRTFAAASGAGTISISAVLGAVLEGSLRGQGGGAGTTGGTLNVTLAGHGYDPSNGTPSGPWSASENTFIIIEPSVLGSHYLSNAQIGTPGTNLATFPIDAAIPLSTQMVQDGGFANLILNTPPGTQSPNAVNNTGYGYITFSGNTALTLPGQLILNTGTIVVPTNTTQTLTADYIQWANTALDSVQPGAAAGVGVLNFVASNMDLVGDLAVQGAKITSLTVSGDLRLTGTTSVSTSSPQLQGVLVSEGELDFRVGQIYPSTDTLFTLNSETSKIVLTANGTAPPTPLSAGGVLNILAPDVEQGGTLVAPLGTINLGAAAQNDTATFVRIVATANDFHSSGAVGLGEWDFTTTLPPDQNFLPGLLAGQSVSLTKEE